MALLTEGVALETVAINMALLIGIPSGGGGLEEGAADPSSSHHESNICRTEHSWCRFSVRERASSRYESKPSEALDAYRQSVERDDALWLKRITQMTSLKRTQL